MAANGETIAETDRNSVENAPRNNVENAPEKVNTVNSGIEASNNILENMTKLKNKLRGQKSAMTREYGRLEEFISDYKQACDDGDPDSILKTLAQDLVTSNEKMRNYREELESTSSELTQLMYSCLNNELENNSPEDAVNKVYEDVDKYVSKYKKTRDVVSR